MISLSLFAVSNYVIIPCWQRYRNRYSQYLPLETIANQTTSIRERMQSALARFATPSAWRIRSLNRVVVAERGSFDSEDGEELGEVNESTARRVLDQQRGGQANDSTARLGRESV